MKTSSLAKYGSLALVLLLAACGGGGGNTSSTPNTGGVSATSFINWTWVNGGNTTFQLGDYGVQSAPAVTNQPRALEGAVSWTDALGNLWMFGGGGIDSTTNSAGNSGDFNDMWKYNTTTKQWTWLTGTATLNQLGTYGVLGTAGAGNSPGARQYSSTWTDSAGDLWLFGGYVRTDVLSGSTAFANDLWKFNPVSNQWTWINGSDLTNQIGSHGSINVTSPSNVPSARYGAVSWKDASGIFWMFGGLGLDSTGATGYLNDLWKFDGANWTWVSGAKTISQVGVYGAKGIAALGNIPGGRSGAAGWKDASNNLWLFGGYGFGSAGRGDLNDMWKFDGAKWTWVSGDNTTGQLGSYGTPGVASAISIPGARRFSVTWTDNNGKFWLFGGARYNASFNTDDYNDLWKFDGSNWIWMSGSNATNQSGTYGPLGSTALANVPGARDVAVSWTDSNGKFWLFGGQGYDSLGSVGYLNDLWSFAVK